MNKCCFKLSKLRSAAANRMRRQSSSIILPAAVSTSRISTSRKRNDTIINSSSSSEFSFLRRWNNNSNTTTTTITTTTNNNNNKRCYSSTTNTKNKKTTVSITFVEADGTSRTIDAEIGKDLMTAAHENDIELEGACGGELACSTCHLIFEDGVYDSLPEKDDEEDDMLDLAFEVTDTSRLGCQVIVQNDFDGITVQIPDDGF